LASEYGVAPVQISQWKRQLLEEATEVYGRKRQAVDPETLTAPLYQEVGRLKMELDWLKKSWPCRLRRNGNVWNRITPS